MQPYFTAHRRQIIVIIVIALALYGLVPAVGGLGELRRLQALQWPLLGLGFGLQLLTYACAAASYQVLALHRLRWWPTLFVELAGLFVNRVLPAGLGGMGLNFLYLRTHRHSAQQAASVTLLNNALGFIANLLALGLLLLILPHGHLSLHLPPWRASWTVAVGAGLILAIAAGLWQRARLRRYERQAAANVAQLLRFYGRAPHKPLLALLYAPLLALGNAACFWLCCRAVGLQIPFLSAYIISGAGVLVGSATPTPGGLGGVEAGTIGALVALGQPAAVALNATLAYRVVSFWVPLVVGAAATAAVRRLGLVKLKY